MKRTIEVIKTGHNLVGKFSEGNSMKFSIYQGIAAVSDNYNDIEEIYIPDSIIYEGKEYCVKEIGSYAFMGCTNLKHIVMPDTIEEIGIRAFDGCSQLSELKMPEGIKTVHQFAFRNCTGLKKVEFPEGFSELCNCAFDLCDHLEEIWFKNEHIRIVEDTNFDIFEEYPEAEEMRYLVDGIPGEYAGFYTIHEDRKMYLGKDKTLYDDYLDGEDAIWYGEGIDW